jgi:hypothetical protein
MNENTTVVGPEGQRKEKPGQKGASLWEKLLSLFRGKKTSAEAMRRPEGIRIGKNLGEFDIGTTVKIYSDNAPNASGELSVRNLSIDSRTGINQNVEIVVNHLPDGITVTAHPDRAETLPVILRGGGVETPDDEQIQIPISGTKEKLLNGDIILFLGSNKETAAFKIIINGDGKLTIMNYKK